jgi:hypothetical protein
MRILAIPFDLSCAGEPVGEGDHGSGWCPKIPTVDEAVNCTCSEDFGMMGRKVDIGDST